MLLTWENGSVQRIVSLVVRSTFMVKRSGLYPWVHIDVAGTSAVGQPGGVLLSETVRVSGLGRVLVAGLSY